MRSCWSSSGWRDALRAASGGDHRLYGKGGRIALLDAGMTIFAVQGGTGKSDLISVFGGSGVETRQRPIIGIT
jgi:hypothetical protein